MLTRTRLGWSIDSATPGVVGALGRGGQGLHRARSADRRRRGLGHFLQRAAADPFRDHQAAGAGVDDVEDTGDAEFVEAAQSHGASQDFADLLVGQPPVRIDERQRHLPIQRGVQRLPELQVRRPAVEHQQPVATAGDAGAGDQVLFVGIGSRSAASIVARRIGGFEDGIG